MPDDDLPDPGEIDERPELETEDPVRLANLGLRLLLEIAGLAALAYWGWTQNAGVARYVLAAGLPSVAGTLWAVFRVPGDETSGEGLVLTPGPVRLALELVLFGGATVALWVAAQPIAAGVLGVLTLVHYAVDYRRVAWLLTGVRPGAS